MIGGLTRAVDRWHYNAARSARRLEREVAGVQDSLTQGLIHSDILDLGQLDDAGALRKQSGFVLDSVAGDSELRSQPPQVSYDGEQLQNHGQCQPHPDLRLLWVRRRQPIDKN